MSLLATRGMCSSIIAAQCSSSSRVSKANEDMLLYLMTMQFYHLIYGRKASLTRFRRRKTITFTCLFGAISKKGLFLTMERLVLCVLTFFGGSSSCAIMPTDLLCASIRTPSTEFSSGLSLVVSVKLA